jgi:hypothetical protein
VQLTGKPQLLKIEYCEGIGMAMMVLAWMQHGGFGEQIVPSSAFSHDEEQEKLLEK